MLRVGVSASLVGTIDGDGGNGNPDAYYPDPTYFTDIDLWRDTQGLGTIQQPPGGGQYYDYSPPFTVVGWPTSCLPYDFLPVSIIYNPPGNNSMAALTAEQSYSTTFSFTVSGVSSTTTADVDGNAFDLGAKASFNGVPFGAQASFPSGSTSFGTVVDATANTTTISASAFVDLGKGSCSTACTTAAPQDGMGCGGSFNLWPLPDSAAGDNVGSPWTNAFWGDLIGVAPWPIIATWQPPASTGGLTPSAAQLIGFVSGGQKQATLYYPVWKLYCAVRSGSTCFDMQNVLQLTSDECAELLKVDPFYSGGMWQGVDPTVLDSKRFIYVAPLTGPDNDFCMCFQQGLQINGEQTALTSTGGSQTSGLQVNLSLAGSGLSGGGSSTEQNTISVGYQAQETSMAAQAVTACGRIEDITKTIYASDGTTVIAKYNGGFPHVLHLYYDLVFNNFLVRDTNQPAPPLYFEGFRGENPQAVDWPTFCGGGPAQFSEGTVTSQYLTPGTLSELEGEIGNGIFGGAPSSGPSGSNQPPTQYWLPPGTLPSQTWGRWRPGHIPRVPRP